MPSSINEFLQQHASGLQPLHPLSYRLPIWIRFDLQPDYNTTDERYFQEVVQRASTLFEAVFEPDDEVLVVYQDHRHNRHRIRYNGYFMRQLGIRKKELTFQSFRSVQHSDAFYEGNWSRACFSTTTSRIPYRNILAAISNQDFPPRSPAIHGLVYFFNKTKGLIFHMYDDRGLDIFGPTAIALRPLYETYNHWILDYNRQEIAATFAL